MIFLVLFFILLCPQFVQGETYWTSPDGGAGDCDAASGTSDPGDHRTLVQGFACLKGGDTLRLKPGTYNLGIINDLVAPSGLSAGQPTIIETASSSETILIYTDGYTGTTNRLFNFDGNSNIIVRGTGQRNLILRSKGPQGTCAAVGNGCCGSGGHGFVIRGSNVTITNIEIAGGFNQGIYGTGTNLTISNNDFHHIGRRLDGTITCDVGGGFGNDTSHCHPIYFVGGSGVVIENNYSATLLATASNVWSIKGLRHRNRPATIRFSAATGLLETMEAEF